MHFSSLWPHVSARYWALNLSTGVASVDILYGHQVEFHTNEENPLHSDAARRIHHCLLRVQGSKDVQALTNELTAISDTLAHFTHLETIVLETGHELEIGDVQSLVEALLGWPQSGPELVRTDEDRELDRWSGPGSVRSDVLFARSGPRSFEGGDGPDQSEPKANL